MFIPGNNVGTDRRIHQEIPVPDSEAGRPVTGETAHDSGDTGPDGVRM